MIAPSSSASPLSRLTAKLPRSVQRWGVKVNSWPGTLAGGWMMMSAHTSHGGGGGGRGLGGRGLGGLGAGGGAKEYLQVGQYLVWADS